MLWNPAARWRYVLGTKTALLASMLSFPFQGSPCMPDQLPPDDLSSPPHKARILVIDDEAEIRESLETLLELEGFSVDLGVNATDGLRKAEAGNYDLILLDLM